MENLEAAILRNTSHTIFSGQEFQDLLNLWFNEKGVLTELKLHLRFKLINLLKDTTIGRGINQNNSQTVSLSNQATNLIIAEHLMQNKYHYSLSIFNTEAAFPSVWPDYPICFNDETNRNVFHDTYFDRENILKMLDLIGFTKTNPLYNKLLHMYFNEEGNRSILSCLISIMCLSCGTVGEVNDKTLNKNLDAVLGNFSDIEFIKKMEELLTNSNLPIDYVKKICQKITFLFETKEQQQKELLDVINQLKSETILKNKTIKKLHKSKHKLQSQLQRINENYGNKMLHLEKMLQKKTLSNESILQQKEQIDSTKVNNDESRDNLQHNELPIPSQEDKALCKLPHCSQICKENIAVTAGLLNENTILKKENEKQKDLLQKLFLIYKNLLNKIENRDINLNLLNSSIDEEFSEDILQHYLYGNNLKVKKEERADDTEESSDNITEEILHQARVKLQTLEDETNEIEDKFKFYHYS